SLPLSAFVYFYQLVAHRSPLSLPTRRASDLLSAALERRHQRQHQRPQQQEEHEHEQHVPHHEGTAMQIRDVAETTAARICMAVRSEEHTSELQSRFDLVCRLLLEQKKRTIER